MTEERRPAEPTWAYPALFALLLAAALALRLASITTGFDWDEGATWQQARGTLAQVFERTALDTYPVGYNLLVWVSYQLFGVAEWSTRLPALVADILDIAFVWWLAARLGGRTAALLATALFTLSVFAIAYAGEGRGYSLMMLGGTALAACLLETAVRPRLLPALGAAVAAIVLLYSHPYGTLAWLALLAPMLLAIVLRRGPLGSIALIVVSQVLAALAFVPGALALVAAAGRLARDGFWIGRPVLINIVDYVRLILGGWPGLVLVAAGCVLLFVPRRSLETKPPAVIPLSLGLPLLAGWALGPVLLGFAISQVATPILLPRYIIVSLPAFYLLAALGLSRVAAGPRAILATLALVLVVQLVMLVPPRPAHTNDWRVLGTYLNQELGESDCLVLWGDIDSYALRFYLDPALPCVERLAADTAARMSGRSRVLFVSSNVWSPETFTLDMGILGWGDRKLRFGSITLDVLTPPARP